MIYDVLSILSNRRVCVIFPAHDIEAQTKLATPRSVPFANNFDKSRALIRDV